MNSINVKNLTVAQISELMKRSDFNKIFMGMSPSDKKIFLEKMKNLFFSIPK